MTGIPTEDRPPAIKMPWLRVWRDALAALKESDVWSPEMRPLLDEYVLALKGAQDARDGFAWLEHLESAVASDEIDWVVLSRIASGLPTAWDRHVKRAAALADQLCLTPRGRKAAGLVEREGDGDDVSDPFAALDELAPRREAKSPMREGSA